MNTIRDFMPGECTLGPEAAAFEAVDHAQTITPDLRQRIEIARLACLGCEQLEKCREQISGIKDVLSARAEGSQFVIGGEVADRVEPKETDQALNEPNFVFDLARVPDNPRQQLELVRQGFRSAQLRGSANMPRHYKQVNDRLYERLIDAEPELDETDRQEIAKTVAYFALQYRIAQNHILPSQQRSKAKLTEAELSNFEALQDIFADDVQALQAMNMIQPIKVARLHKPEFYAHIMEKYGNSYDVTPGYIRSMCTLVLDPLAKVKEAIAKNRQLKEAANTGELDESDLAAINAGGTYVVRAKTVRREKLLNFTRIPEASPYIQIIAKKNISDHKTEVKNLYKRIRTLQTLHPDVEVIALAAIAYHQEDPEHAVQVFKTTFESLQQKYEGHGDLSKKKLQKLAFENIELSKAETATEAYLSRLQVIKDVSSQAGIKITDVFARAYAFDFTQEREIDAQTVAYEFKKYRLLRPKHLRLLEGWMREKIAQFYEEDTFMEVAENLTTFLRRGYLKPVFSIEETPSMSRNHIDSKKGRYLTWNEDFSAFTAEEQKAILFASHLDQLVLGTEVDEEKLKIHFATDNIRRYVAERLLPNTLAESVDLKDETSILSLLRRSVKDYPKRTRLKKPQEKLLNDAAQEVLATLKDEGLEGHDVGSRECTHNIRLLLLQLAFQSSSKLKNKQLVANVTRAYLSDVSRVQANGLREAYTIARGYGADFCNYFVALGDGRNYLTKGRANTLLRSLATQATLELRKFQGVMRESKPLFEERSIKSGYLAHVSFTYRDDAQKVKDTIHEYDDVIETFGSNSTVNTATIHSFCFIQLKKNVTEEVREWLDTINNLDPLYKQKLEVQNIKQVARFRRGEELIDDLNTRIKEVDTILEEYKIRPHPAVDRSVIEYAVFRSSQPRKWLKDEYFVRWSYVQRQVDTSDIPFPVLRRLVLLHANAPLSAVNIYRRICRDYEGDKHIDQPTIERAVNWDLSRAGAVLKRTRAFLVKQAVELNKSVGESGKATLNDFIPDTAAISPDSVVEKIANQQTIATLLGALSAMEKAVVAVVHGLSWLTPAELRDEDEVDIWRIMKHYQVTTFDDLEPIANNILANLKPQQAMEF